MLGYATDKKDDRVFHIEPEELIYVFLMVIFKRLYFQFKKSSHCQFTSLIRNKRLNHLSNYLHKSWMNKTETGSKLL